MAEHLQAAVQQTKLNKKNQWKKPQLIVLGRGTPEESILLTCKGPGTNGPGRPNCKHPTLPPCDTSGRS